MKKGMVYVIICYLLWGVLPVYWKQLQTVNSVYILASRVFWSLIFIICFLLITGKATFLKAALMDKKSLLYCALSGFFICINWGVYIWAVNHGHIVDSSLGYYLNPLIVVGISALFFHEQLRKNEWIAVGVSAIGVLVAVISSHTIPVIALLIGGSFAIYGALKKKVAYNSEISMFFETLFMSPFAILFILYSEGIHTGALDCLSGVSFLLVPLAGIVTAVPLLFFAAGVKAVPYYFTGILMYVNPTLQLLIGVYLYQEAFTWIDAVVFVFIWGGVLAMIVEKVSKAKAGKEV